MDVCHRPVNVSASDVQSEVGEIFGEIGGELPAKFGWRFSSFCCWGKSSEHFPPKLHRKFHHQTSLRGSGLWRALLMGLFRRAVFHHGGGAGKQPIKQPTEMPTRTMALMGRFPSLMGRFLTLMGRFPRFRPKGPFYLLKIHWKTAHELKVQKLDV